MATEHDAARQRVVDAARLVESWHDDQCACPVCEAVRDLDALGPEPAPIRAYTTTRDVAAGMIATEADIHDARSLAWAAGRALCEERDYTRVASSWWLALAQPGNVASHGWWPTRDGEHARAVAFAAIRATRAAEPPTLEQRLAALETAVMGHECAGPRELIDTGRLDEAMLAIEEHSTQLRTLAAHGARIESVVRQVACWMGNTTGRQDVHDRIVRRLDGGDDA